MLKKFGLLMLTMFCGLALSAGQKVTDKGYSALLSFRRDAVKDGSILVKDKVFKLELKSGQYIFTLFDKDGKVAAELRAAADAKTAQTIVVVLERLNERAQGLDGYRPILFVNGKRVSETERTTLALAADTSADPVVTGDIQVKEHSRMVSNQEIRTFSGIVISRRWRPSTDGAVLLENDELIVNIRNTAGKGNPLLGVYNKISGSPLLTAGGIDWVLLYRDADGISHYMSCDDFTYSAPEIKRDGKNSVIDIVWKNRMFEVSSRWNIQGGRFETDMKVKVLDPTAVLTKITFPRYTLIKLAGKDTAVVPYFSGIEKYNPTENLNYHYIWPTGSCTMQFFMYYNDQEHGVYIAREDASGAVKDMEAIGSGGLLETAWVMAIPRGTTEIAMPGKAVLEVYRGTWFEGGQIYKKFAMTTPWWIKDIPRKDTPEWFLKNPFWVTNMDYLTQGEKYETFYRQVTEFFEMKPALETGMLLMPSGRWGFGPDYVYKEGVLDGMKLIQKNLGWRIGPYYNPRLCYAGPTADQENNYSKTGKLYAVKDEFGLIRHEFFGPHAVMCPGSSGWQKQLYSNVARLGRGGIDYIYHDQLPCGRPYACNADNHDHLVNDPWAWLAKGHWITYKRIRTELKKELPDYSHTGEDASEPFLHCIDGFMVWRFGMPGHVPLFQAIYAPRIQFVGRGCDGSLVPGTYDSFFPKYGEQLVFNEQIGWAAEESLRYPSTRRNYLKKLAHLRQASVDFFIAAEMMAPLKFRVKPETMACRWGVQSTSNVVTDKILHGVWRNIDGRKMIIFLNTVNEEQTVEPLIKFDFENMTACREIGQKVQKYGKKLPEKVTLAPYGVEFWFFDVKDDDPDVKKVSEKLLFTVGVMASDRGYLEAKKQDFGKYEKIDAVAKPVHAVEADWMLFAYQTTRNTIDFQPKSKVETLRRGWIAAEDGAVISYGETFIGKDTGGIEIELATDQKDVVVEFVDVSPNQYNLVLAEIKPVPGEWFEFKKYKVEWKNKTTNSHPHMIVRVRGGSCRIRTWQVYGAK